MASKSSAKGGHRLSFAKIAAMPAPSKSNDDSNGSRPVETSPSPSQDMQGSKDSLTTLSSSSNAQHDDPKGVDRDVDGLSQAVQDAHLTDKKSRENSETSGDPQENGALKRENSFEDDRTHLSNSSTKLTSFDSKSMASVATFAMDEKDSLRPDDSASVQAIDEEESLSGAASGAPNSLTGSESGARGFSIHKSRAILQNAGPTFHDGNQRSNGVNNTDSVSNNYVLFNPGPFQGGRELHGFPQEPDEKLLEAMKSPKDRLLILQLEDKIRHFIQHSKEQSLELPPSNAFGRLLAHKLGDYYHLTHFVDNNVTSVRLHRTPFCRLYAPVHNYLLILDSQMLTSHSPAPLSALEHASNTPPPPMPAMKIMRRTDGERPSTEGSTAASSVPASEAGDSGNERGGSSTGATPAKDRLTLTREEREAKYHEVRERIFRDFPDSKSSDNPNGDQNANMSRSSSTSGRKKAARQKTPHDDSFEARSQFNAYYPGFNYNHGPIPYNVAMNDPSIPSQPPYMVGPGVAPPGMGYSHGGQNAMYSGPMHMNSMPQYPMPVSPQMSPNVPWQGGNVPQQSPFSGYASVNQSPAMMNQQPSAKSSPALNSYAIPNSVPYQHAPPNWPSPQYHGNFQQPAYRSQPPVHWPNYPSQPMTSTTSYPYAQYPGQPMMGMQNPMPGTFARSPFNPQTRSFVPGGAPISRHPSKGNQPGVAPYPPMHPGVQPQWGGFPDSGRNAEAHSAVRGPPLNNKDSIAKWGTPSHLPPKPPPSAVPSDFDLKHRNMTSIDPHAGNMPNSKNGPLVVSGGTSVPNSN